MHLFQGQYSSFNSAASVQIQSPSPLQFWSLWQPGFALSEFHIVKSALTPISGVEYIEQTNSFGDIWLLRLSHWLIICVTALLLSFSKPYELCSTVCPDGPIPAWTLALRWAVWICGAPWQNQRLWEGPPHPGLTMNWWDIIGEHSLLYIFIVVSLFIINGISISLLVKSVEFIICILLLLMCFPMNLL